ncbi:MAG: hypothetical protein IH586_17655 [Anaerolineaceae bacterium]|nr:hypothetical protein [Anaerolineaceae bacterium]
MLDTTRPAMQSAHPALRSEPKAVAATAVKKERFLYIDNLRLLMIIFVILIHTAVTYSGLGDWYYKEETQLDPSMIFLFGLPMAFTQAYFYGHSFPCRWIFRPWRL